MPILLTSWLLFTLSSTVNPSFICYAANTERTLVGGGSSAKKKERGMTQSLMEYAAELRDQLRRTPDAADVHLGLGITLQNIDLQEHTGGTFQPEALEAYKNAKRLGVSESHRVTLLLNYGVLLTTMSRPSEALVQFSDALALEDLVSVNLYPLD